MPYSLPRETKTSKLNSLDGDLREIAEELIAKKFGVPEVIQPSTPYSATGARESSEPFRVPPYGATNGADILYNYGQSDPRFYSDQSWRGMAYTPISHEALINAIKQELVIEQDTYSRQWTCRVWIRLAMSNGDVKLLQETIMYAPTYGATSNDVNSMIINRLASNIYDSIRRLPVMPMGIL